MIATLAPFLAASAQLRADYENLSAVFSGRTEQEEQDLHDDRSEYCRQDAEVDAAAEAAELA